MEFRNYSNHQEVDVAINSGLPISPDTVVGRLSSIGKGAAGTVNIPQGPTYYVYVANSGPGTLPAGTTIAQMGGVYASSTITLDENDVLTIT